MLSHINVGSGEEVTILDVAKLIGNVVGYEGKIEFDATKPDGSPRKLMDSAKLASLQWAPTISLRAGLTRTYAGFKAQCELSTSKKTGACG